MAPLSSMSSCYGLSRSFDIAHSHVLVGGQLVIVSLRHVQTRGEAGDERHTRRRRRCWMARRRLYEKKPARRAPCTETLDVGVAPLRRRRIDTVTDLESASTLDDACSTPPSSLAPPPPSHPCRVDADVPACRGDKMGTDLRRHRGRRSPLPSPKASQTPRNEAPTMRFLRDDDSDGVLHGRLDAGRRPSTTVGPATRRMNCEGKLVSTTVAAGYAEPRKLGTRVGAMEEKVKRARGKRRGGRMAVAVEEGGTDGKAGRGVQERIWRGKRVDRGCEAQPMRGEGGEERQRKEDP
ncbi:hypothetical protein NLJ89_g9590 [Agrocybe chaxingu]|uniref:Uncharacterized protein n=1 Tax=Agrocybe chaxingu TaxID=84603 RepID=A0A9W8JQH4_9AGAR|nr:hypothetical protein NLJ89_g9590 [Agrocybe chaxingu]